MTMTDHDPHIPDDLAASLRRAAAQVPPADLHPTTPVERLGTRRRRRRTFAASGIAAALLVGVVVANQTLVDHDDVTTGEPAGAPSTQDTPPGGTEPLDPSTFDGPVELTNQWTELLPDGTLAPLPTAQPEDGPIDAVRLPDGRLVTLASRDLMPGVTREDGPFVEGVAHVLAVFDTEGQLVVEQDIRVPGDYVRLVGQHDGRVVVLRYPGEDHPSDRGGKVVTEISTIDPATFEETPVTSMELPIVLNGRIHVAGGRLVAIGDGPLPGDGSRATQCQVSALDLTSGTGWDLPPVPCSSPNDVAVSPDGRYAAITSTTLAGEEGLLTLWHSVIDLDQNQAVVSEQLGSSTAPCREQTGSCAPPTPLATTWTGDREVTVVLAPPGSMEEDPETGPVVDPELLVTRTFTVP